MTPYLVNLDPELVVQWLLDERHVEAFGLDIRACRTYQTRPLGSGASVRPGGADCADPGERVEVGRLEIGPLWHDHVWVMRSTVADDGETCMPPEESVSGAEEVIDLDGFGLDFIDEDRVRADLKAEVGDYSGTLDLERVLNSINATARRQSTAFRFSAH